MPNNSFAAFAEAVGKSRWSAQLMLSADRAGTSGLRAETEVQDLILVLITAYTSALAYAEEFNRAAGELSDDAYQELASKTHYPLRQALIDSTEVATTAEGARAALALAMHEYEIGETPLISRMMEAAHGYLAGRS